MAQYFMRNRGSHAGYTHDILFGVLHAFTNGFRNFGGFAGSDPDASVPVAYDDQRAEAEVTSTLYDLGHPRDMNNPFLKLLVFWFSVSSVQFASS